jgi:hypothetical protein
MRRKKQSFDSLVRNLDSSEAFPPSGGNVQSDSITPSEMDEGAFLEGQEARAPWLFRSEPRGSSLYASLAAKLRLQRVVHMAITCP